VFVGERVASPLHFFGPLSAGKTASLPPSKWALKLGNSRLHMPGNGGIAGATMTPHRSPFPAQFDGLSAAEIDSNQCRRLGKS
jgi:hypothetical protein